MNYQGKGPLVLTESAEAPIQSYGVAEFGACGGV